MGQLTSQGATRVLGGQVVVLGANLHKKSTFSGATLLFKGFNFAVAVATTIVLECHPTYKLSINKNLAKKSFFLRKIILKSLRDAHNMYPLVMRGLTWNAQLVNSLGSDNCVNCTPIR